jgi:hypothetical protein
LGLVAFPSLSNHGLASKWFLKVSCRAKAMEFFCHTTDLIS